MKLLGYELNLWVLAGMLIASVVLGVVNNMRVYDEQQVPWWVDAEDAEEDEG